MSQRVSPTYGLPFRGHVSSLREHEAPRDVAIDGATLKSQNMLFVPSDGSWKTRLGSAIQFDTGGIAAPVGLLEGKWSARCRQLAPLYSTSLADGEPAVSGLYTKETVTGVDDGRFGQMYFRSTNSTDYNHVCGDTFTGHYPISNVVPDIFCVPLWYDSGEGGLTRLNSKLARRFHVPGSRRFLDNRGKRYFPSYYGTPSNWNLKFNDTTGAGTESEEYYPSGPIPPLWCPVVDTLPASSATLYSWGVGKSCYYSVMFRHKDGSYSMPAMPSVGAMGFCSITGTAGQYVQYVPLKHIPIGGPDVEARILLRTKQQGVTSATGATAGPATGVGQLYIVANGIIEDNVTTTFNDYNGDDASLIDDTDRLYLRLDHIMPPMARYIWESDGRIWHGYGRTNRAAIVIAPMGSNSDYDLNKDYKSSTLYGTITNHMRVVYDTVGATWGLELINVTGALAATTYVQWFPFSSYATLQALVDAVNATAFGGNNDGYRAQVAPGADPFSSPNDLLPHVLSVANCSCSGSSTITTTASFSEIAVGRKVYGDAKVNGLYVKSVDTTGQITLCDNTGATATASGSFGPITLYFAVDVGDDAFMDAAGYSGPTAWRMAPYGFQRIVSGSYYGILYFRNSHFARENTHQGKRSVWMTIGGPGQVRASAMAFTAAAGNKHTAPGEYGILQGGGPLSDGCVVAFARAIYKVRNNRGGRSGLDYDYRMDPVNLNRGCIAWSSFAVGDGLVGYETPEGYVVCDLDREALISRALWDNGTQQGSFAYEHGQCLTDAYTDTDNCWFSAAFIGHELHLTLRKAAGSYPDSRYVMDFGEGTAASGIQCMLQGDGTTPWGWSTRLVQPVSKLCAVMKSGAQLLYGSVDDNAGSTGNGRIDQLETTQKDNATDYFGRIVCVADRLDTMMQKSNVAARVVHYVADGGHALKLKVDQSGATVVTKALNFSSGSLFYVEEVRYPISERYLSDIFQFYWEETSARTTQVRLFGWDADFDILNRVL